MPIDPNQMRPQATPGDPFAGVMGQQAGGISPEMIEAIIQMLLQGAPPNPIPGMAQGGPQPIDPELAMIMQQAGPGYDPNMSDVQRRQVGSSPVPTGDGPMPRQQPNALSPEEIQRMLQQDRGAGKFGR